jgi:hypothetical protein
MRKDDTRTDPLDPRITAENELIHWQVGQALQRRRGPGSVLDDHVRWPCRAEACAAEGKLMPAKQ